MTGHDTQGRPGALAAPGCRMRLEPDVERHLAGFRSPWGLAAHIRRGHGSPCLPKGERLSGLDTGILMELHRTLHANWVARLLAERSGKLAHVRPYLGAGDTPPPGLQCK